MLSGQHALIRVFVVKNEVVMMICFHLSHTGPASFS